jgi:Tfp pilus assembly protein PilF
MSIHLARARLLLQQSRPADAEREAGLAIAGAPDDPQAFALLAISRLEQGKKQPALEAARSALGLAPDSPYGHYIHALVLHRNGSNKEALAAVQEAIRLAPEDGDNFSLCAAIHLNLGDWSAALAAAGQALALDPESTEAANFRSMALVRLGRKTEAMETVEAALARDPESPMSHANQGWNCLHRNDPARAQEHFREALRLDPNLEYAREGMLEALKARNWIYRGMLAYFLWMGRQKGWLQATVIVVFVLGTAVLGGLVRTQPLAWIPLGLVYAFVYLTWTSTPMFNLFLLLDRYGRHVLTRDMRIGALWFGGTVAAAALAALAGFLLPQGLPLLIGALLLLALSIIVAITFVRTGRNRLIYAAITAGLAGLGVATCLALARGDRESFAQYLGLFRRGFFWSQILTYVLRE